MAARYRLQGRVGADARMLRWFYGIVADPYPLTIRARGRSGLHRVDQRHEVERLIDLTGAVHPAVALARSGSTSSLGYTHILPKGLDHILFVLGMFLLSPRLEPCCCR